MADVFKALADPTRREILLMVAREPTNVNDIAKRFTMSRPAISRHIKILRESNLVSIEPGQDDGRQLQCSARLEALKEVEDYMQELESFWRSRLSGLGKYLDEKRME